MNIFSMQSPKTIGIYAFQILSLSFVFFASALVAAEFRFGSLAGARAYIAGVRVLADTSYIRENYDPNLKEATFTFVLRNLDDKDVAILGSTASCACTVTDQLPALIQAGGHSEVLARVTIDPKQSGEDLLGEIHVFTGHKSQHEIVLSYLLKPMPQKSGKVSNRDLTR